MILNNSINDSPKLLQIIVKSVIALVMVLLAIALGLALFSYSVEDPWFLHASGSNNIHNFLGIYGAYIAAPIMQILGRGGYLLVVFIALFNWHIINKNKVSSLLRISAFFITLPLFSIFLASLSPISIDDNNIYMYRSGGALGYYIITELQVSDLPFVFLQSDIALYSGLVFVPLIIFAFRFPIYTIGCWIAVVFLTTYGRYRHRRNEIKENKRQIMEQEIMTKDKITNQHNFDNFENETISEIMDLDNFGIGNSIDKNNIILKNNKDGAKTLNISKYSRQTNAKHILPGFNLLNVVENKKSYFIAEEIEAKSVDLKQTLNDFGVRGEIVAIHPGPVVTLYELEPAAGTKSSRVVGLADDIARSMMTVATRIAVIPGKNAIGIELPNKVRQIVSMRELVESSTYHDENIMLPLILGKDIGGKAVIADLAKMPHLLIAGTTGSGKSVAINTMILSLLYRYTPEECRLVMIDPKMLELSVYDGIPHLLTPVVTDSKKAINVLKWVIREMEARYRAMAMLGVRNILGYNKIISDAKQSGHSVTKTVQTGFDHSGEPLFETIKIKEEKLPYIVVVVDEMADLMLVAGKDIEAYIQRLAQMARAAGIHLIMATQRPSVDVITGVIKANFPTRISFQVTSKIDSRTIIGEMGAEQLLGMGDMLYMMPGGRIDRVHGPYVSDSEVEKIVSFLKSQGAPQYVENIDEVIDEDGYGDDRGSYSGDKNGGEDDLYSEALEIVLREKRASTSYIQRCLKIGYNRAASLIERMEKNGVVSGASHTGKREVLK